jgi:hypothetical protein
MPLLRAVIVMDYQNVHLTGHGLFSVSRHLPPHEALVHPLHFANQLIRARNLAQRPDMDHALLVKVLVYRGLPLPEHDPKPYARNQAQKANWERDRRVSVHMRPMKYRYQRDAAGRPASGPDGQRIVTGKDEKGVDVLCALALVREARLPDVDLVVLASHDSDLEPALDEAIALQSAKVETFSWLDAANPGATRQLRAGGGRRIWNTRLGETEFRNCWDTSKYP